MAGKIILITHDTDANDDRASAWLARRGFDCQWVHHAGGEPLPQMGGDIAATIVYGGRDDVGQKFEKPYLANEGRWLAAAMKRDIPVLGLCLGAQLMADVLGQRVSGHPQGRAEYGYYPLIISPEGEKVLGTELTVLESHWHGWHEVPGGAVHLAGTKDFPCQAFSYGLNAYAFQFHPETSFATMSLWAGRRGERNYLPGAYPPERQKADFKIYDKKLGDWFEEFLERWSSPLTRAQAAAE